MARDVTCGFETGYSTGAAAGMNELVPLGNTGSGNSGTVITVVAKPAWWYSAGAYVLKLTGGATSGTFQRNGNTVDWVGFKWGTSVLPAAERNIWLIATQALKVTVDANGALRLYTGSTLRATSANGAVQALKCHLIEIKGVSGDYQVWVDGTQILTSATGTDQIFNWDLGWTDRVAGEDFYYDDIYANTSTASASNQTGRRGWASCVAVAPSADSGSAPTGFTNSTGLTYGNATTGWFSAIDDALPYAGGTTDFLGKSTANTNRSIHDFADTSGSPTVNAVYLVAMMKGATALACNMDFLLRANAIDGTAQSVALASTTPLVACIYADVASSGVAWTSTLVDGAQVKVGGSTDVSPNPQVHAVYLIYEQAESAPSSVTPISGTDANSTTTEAATLAAKPSSTDANSTTTESGTPTALIPGTDANGPVTETVVETAQIPSTDANGTVVEAGAIRQSTADSCTATETATVTVVMITVDANNTTTEATGTRLYGADTNAVPTEAIVLVNLTTTSDVNGSVTESVLLGQAFSGADANGATTETTSQVAQIPAADANSTITEVLALKLSGVDTNSTTTEVTIEVAQVPASDVNGVVTEAFALKLVASDANSVVTETVTETVMIGGTDVNGTSVENGALAFATVDANGVTTEATTQTAAISNSDTNSTTEVGSPRAVLSSSDVNTTTTEAATETAALTSADANAATTEATSETAAIPATDANGATGEIGGTGTIKSGSDANSTTTEGITLKVVLSGADTNTSSEIGSTAHTGTDSGGSSETASEAASIPGVETGSASDSQALTSRPVASETGSATDAFALTAKISVPEIVTAFEAGLAQAVLQSLDNGTGNDLGNVLSQQVFASDSNLPATEAAALIAVVLSAEEGFAAEDQVVTTIITSTPGFQHWITSIGLEPGRLVNVGITAEGLVISHLSTPQLLSVNEVEKPSLLGSVPSKPQLTKAGN